MKLAKTSIVLLVIQLALVSSIAAKYLYQRATCPQAWTRAEAYDPNLVMRGRYLSLRLTVDGCQSTLPSALRATFPRNADARRGRPVTPSTMISIRLRSAPISRWKRTSCWPYGFRRQICARRELM